MKAINDVLGEMGKRNGLDMALDENGACTLELADGRVMLIQERAEMDELDFVATIGQGLHDHLLRARETALYVRNLRMAGRLFGEHVALPALRFDRRWPWR